MGFLGLTSAQWLLRQPNVNYSKRMLSMTLHCLSGARQVSAPSIRELTLDEMDQVNGGNPIGAAIGAATGAAGYLGTASTTGEFSVGGLAVATGTGALSGGFSGVGMLARYAIPRISFFGGAGVGLADGS
jgi:hypothetical protein